MAKLTDHQYVCAEVPVSQCCLIVNILPVMYTAVLHFFPFFYYHAI